MFEKIEGGSVLCRQSGGFKVQELYKRLGRLYVKLGQTYIRLDSAPYTSKNGFFWDSESLEGVTTRSSNPRV